MDLAVVIQAKLRDAVEGVVDQAYLNFERRQGRVLMVQG
jgi:hypothetical protein